MSTHLPWFQSFSGFLYHFVLAKLATSSIRVNGVLPAAGWDGMKRKLSCSISVRSASRQRDYVTDDNADDMRAGIGLLAHCMSHA